MAAKKPVSQSRTMWVKKGTVVNGKAVSKGYLAQYGKPEKRVTGKVTLTRQTGSTAAGETVRYKGGRRVKPAADTRPRAEGGGVRPGQKPTSSASTSSRTTSTSTPSKPRTSSASTRREQNKGVAAGTIRAGAKGRGVRRYNAKTGRWDRVTGASGATAASSQSQRPTSSGYTPGSGTGSRGTTSATVSGAVAAGRAAGPRDTRTPAEKAYDAARASLAEWQKRKLVTAADIAKEKQKRRMVQEALARVKAQGKVK